MASAAVGEDEPPEACTEAMANDPRKSPTMTAFDRNSLCITHNAPDVVLQKGDVGFREQVSRFYDAGENDANEALVKLKRKLRMTKNEDFWPLATQGIGNLLGAQFTFISKRIEEAEGGVQFGEPNSCMLGISIYFNDGKGFEHTSKESTYTATGSPCEYMKHNKVLLIPENLGLIVTNNPNPVPVPPDAYMAVPLSYTIPGTSTEKVFGHFGVMWTADGLAAKRLRYPLIENILHSLEDVIVSRFFEHGYIESKLPGSSNTSGASAAPTPGALIPVSQQVAAAQSFRPYARSLSHELRTPMQGVVGMLDLMYAAVQEASEGPNDLRIQNVFQMLKENIEEVHDSARRAVEAADNVVHAYDMNMSVPDAATTHDEDDVVIHQRTIEYMPSTSTSDVATGVSPNKAHKRQRSSFEVALDSSYKMPRLSSDHSTPLESPFIERTLLESPVRTPTSGSTPYLEGTPSSSHVSLERTIAPGIRPIVVADLLHNIINDVLKIGGRPESAIAVPIEGGEEIEVRQRGQGGEEKMKTVRWSVDSAVPDTILIDERDLTGLLSRVLHNAFKFTESGSITTTVRLSPKGRNILVNVKDTGHGIPIAFMPSLFKAFSKEDDSLTRQSEGLGLGLMVAKGLARRLNGDLYALRSETTGPNRGTEFEMRIPVTAGENLSRPATPYGSRSPSTTSLSNDVEPISQSSVQPPKSPRPPLKHNGPRQNRSASLLSRNVTTSNLMPSPSPLASTNLVRPQLPTPTDTGSTVSISSIASPAVQKEIEAKKRLSPPTQLGSNRRNSHHRKTPPYRKAEEKLAEVLPLAFLVVEDNSLLRKVLIQMLRNLGYIRIHEAYDGQDALRQMESHRRKKLAGEVDYEIDVVLMDLWMPNMNGYSAAECILGQSANHMSSTLDTHDVSRGWKTPLIMAVTADVTDEAINNVAKSGMKGPLTKPYKQIDLERTLVELCAMPPPPTSVASY